jgi:hypothetical protein
MILGRQAVVAVAFDLVAEGADHLAVADIAALADVDVAPGQFERGVGAHPLDLLDGVLQVEQRRDLHDAADGHHQEGEQAKQRDVAFELLVLVKVRCRSHGSRSLFGG